jgi:CRISPR/Cas system-associated exonuclease Cas4 (RecB family)
VAGWRCPRYLWWKVHRRTAPELKPDEPTLDRMRQGTAVGKLATERFPDGVLIDFAPGQKHEKVVATEDAIDDGVPAIFEASFEEDDVFVAVDILERVTGGFRLIEVKSNTAVKEDHIRDVAVQLHVARASGTPVLRAAVMHLNKAYRHPDSGDLFLVEDVTELAEELTSQVPAVIQHCREILEGPEPDPCPKESCAFGTECPLEPSCWPSEPDHIRRLHGIGPKKALRFMERGIHSFGDLPEGASVNTKAWRQLKAWDSGGLLVEEGLSRALEPFRGSVGFLDFETVMRAVPVWDGLGPWGMVPVQFSYHERQRDGTYAHRDWLADGPRDPRPELAEALIAATGGADRVVTYTNYERRCIRALREAVPILASELDDLEGRLIDLKAVVAEHLAHPEFGGSYSIKDVLAPLVPDLTYEDLAVADGMVASVELAHLILNGDRMTEDERNSKREELRAYCRMDTWAMVRLLERLEELAQPDR